jgi:hypothetical protein
MIGCHVFYCINYRGYGDLERLSAVRKAFPRQGCKSVSVLHKSGWEGIPNRNDPPSHNIGTWYPGQEGAVDL